MKIIINATNLRKGGALQVCLSFLEELSGFPENEYYVLLSPAFRDLTDTNRFLPHIAIYFFDYPSRIIFFDRTIKKLNELEAELNPDCVFTVFGPSYWIPKSRHVMGFANGIHLYKDLPYLKNLSLLDKFKWFLLGKYHRFLLKSNAHLYVVETDDVKTRFAKYIGVDEEIVRVASNTCHAIFMKQIEKFDLLPEKKPGEFWLLTVSAFYPHKNLSVIKKLIPILQHSETTFKFVLTLPSDVFNEHFSDFSETIINVGPVHIELCPYLYACCDAMFLPTLVESFTASYPEAMQMRKPILTSDYSFARSICGNAALYFDPFNPENICSQIINLAHNNELYAKLINNGLIKLTEYPTPKGRAEKYLDLCREAISM